MSRKLTDDELREPDITVYVPVEIWLTLPEAVISTLKHFSSSGAVNKTTGQRAIKYVLPAYLARQLEQETLRKGE